MTNENTEMMDIDALLDSTLDDLADAPEFKPFTAGAHRVTIKWDATKKINDIPSVELELKVLETLELKNPEDTPPAVGDETSTAFMLYKKDKETNKIVANELAQGQLKNLLKELASDLKMEGASSKAIMEASNNMEVMAVTAIREDKRDKDNIKRYTAVTSLRVI